jgi:hypothetical protein
MSKRDAMATDYAAYRLPPPDAWGPLKRGHNYFGLNIGEIGVVSEIVGESVFIVEHGSWPHYIHTLEPMDYD